jgi:hypothetical protein
MHSPASELPPIALSASIHLLFVTAQVGRAVTPREALPSGAQVRRSGLKHIPALLSSRRATTPRAVALVSGGRRRRTHRHGRQRRERHDDECRDGEKSRTETRTLSEQRRRNTGMGTGSNCMRGNPAHTQRNALEDNKDADKLPAGIGIMPVGCSSAPASSGPGRTLGSVSPGRTATGVGG